MKEKTITLELTVKEFADMKEIIYEKKCGEVDYSLFHKIYWIEQELLCEVSK